MKLLTEIEKKTKIGQELTKDELIFLYEIYYSIDGFGYQRDPRIKEIRDRRKVEEDAPIVFECDPSEIAYNQDDITENTKAYIGKLFPEIFQKNIEHIFTSFPEGRIEKASMEIGGKTEEELEKEIKEKFKLFSIAESMMRNPDFVTEKHPEKIDIVRLKVRDLGFTKNPTTDELYKRAEELGLELCPAEVGPHLRLKYKEIFKRIQSMYENLFIAMKQIADSGGNPFVFNVRRYDYGEWLYGDWAGPADRWNLDDEFVFRLRKKL